MRKGRPWLLVGPFLAVLLALSQGGGLEPDFVDDAGNYVFVADAEGPGDCSHLEAYDAEEGVCTLVCRPQDCPAALEALDAELAALEEAFEAFSENFKEGRPGAFEGIVEAAYRIDSGERFVLVRGRETPVHQKVKHWLKAISPDPFSDRYLSELILYRDPPESAGDAFQTFALVEPSEDRTRWKVYVNLDTLELGSKETAFTLIHEFFHIYTLNASQIDPEIPPEACPHYSDGEACFRGDALLSRFFERFWKGRGEPYKVGGQRSRSAFVTEYAATGPEEDIAESFAAYVLGRRPGEARTLAQAKILFFHRDPALRALRRQIHRILASVIDR